MSNRPYLKGLLCCVINDLVINCVLCVSLIIVSFVTTPSTLPFKFNIQDNIHPLMKPSSSALLEGDYLELKGEELVRLAEAPRVPLAQAPKTVSESSPTAHSRRRNLQQLLSFSAAFDAVSHSRPMRAPVSTALKSTFYKLIHTNEERTRVIIRSGAIAPATDGGTSSSEARRLTPGALRLLPSNASSSRPPPSVASTAVPPNAPTSFGVSEARFWDPSYYLKSERETRQLEVSGALHGDSVSQPYATPAATSSHHSVVGYVDVNPDTEGFITAIEAVVLPSSSGGTSRESNASAATSTRASTVGGASSTATRSVHVDPSGADSTVEVLLFVGTSTGTVLVVDMCRPNDPCEGTARELATVFQRPLRVLLACRLGDKWSLQEKVPDSKAFLVPNSTEPHLGSAAVCKFAVESHTSAARSNPNLFSGAHGVPPPSRRGGSQGYSPVESVWIAFEDGSLRRLPKSILSIIGDGASRHTIPAGASQGMLSSAGYRPHLMRDWHPETTATPFAIAAVSSLGAHSGLSEALVAQTTIIAADQDMHRGVDIMVADVASCARCNTSPVDAVEAGASQVGALVAVGRTPALGAYLVRAEPQRFTTGQVVTEIAGRLAGAALGFVRKGWGWGSGGSKKAPNRDQHPTVEPLILNGNVTASTFLTGDAGDSNNKSSPEMMTTVTVDPTQRFAACYTPLGRIYIFDLQSSLIVRVMKGCRAAECEWVLTTIQGKKQLLLAVHLKFRGVIELFSMKRKRRVGAVKVGEGWSLIRSSVAYEGKHADTPAATPQLAGLVLISSTGSETRLLQLNIFQKQKRGLDGLEQAPHNPSDVPTQDNPLAALRERKVFLFCEALLHPLIHGAEGEREGNDGTRDPVQRVVHACLSKCEAPNDFFFLGCGMQVLLHQLLSSPSLPTAVQTQLLARYIDAVALLVAEVRSVYSPGPNEDIALIQPTAAHWERASTLVMGYNHPKPADDVAPRQSEGCLGNNEFVSALVRYVAAGAIAIAEANHQQIEAAQVHNYFDLQRSLVIGYKSLTTGALPRGMSPPTSTTASSISANIGSVVKKLVSFDASKANGGSASTAAIHHSAELIAVGAKLLAEEAPGTTDSAPSSTSQQAESRCAVFDFLELFWCGSYRLRFHSVPPHHQPETAAPRRAGEPVRAALPSSSSLPTPCIGLHQSDLQAFHLAYLVFGQNSYAAAAVHLAQLGVPQSIVASLYVLWLVFHPNALSSSQLKSAEEAARLLTVAQLCELMRPIPLSMLDDTPSLTTSSSSQVGRRSLIAMAVLLVCKLDQLGGPKGGLDSTVASAQTSALNAFSKLAVLDLLRRASIGPVASRLPLVEGCCLGDLLPAPAIEPPLRIWAPRRPLLLCEVINTGGVLAHELHRVASWLKESEPSEDVLDAQLVLHTSSGDHDDHASEWIRSSVSASLLPRTLYGSLLRRVEVFAGCYSSSHPLQTVTPTQEGCEVIQSIAVYVGGRASPNGDVTVARHVFPEGVVHGTSPSPLSKSPSSVSFATECQHELWMMTLQLETLTTRIVPPMVTEGGATAGFSLAGELIPQLRDVLVCLERLHHKLRWAGLCDPCWERYSKGPTNVTEEDRQRVLQHLIGTLVIDAVACTSLAHLLGPLRTVISRAAETSGWVSEKSFRGGEVFGGGPPTRHIDDYVDLCREVANFVGFRFAEDMVDGSSLLRRAPALMQQDFTSSSWALHNIFGGVTGLFSSEAGQASPGTTAGVEDTLGMFVSWCIERDSERVFPHLSPTAHVTPLERLSSFVQQHRVVGAMNILGDVYAVVSLGQTMLSLFEGSKEIRAGVVDGLVDWASMFEVGALSLLEDVVEDTAKLLSKGRALPEDDAIPEEDDGLDTQYNAKVDAKYSSHQQGRQETVLSVAAALLRSFADEGATSNHDAAASFEFACLPIKHIDYVTHIVTALHDSVDIRADGVVDRAIVEGLVRCGCLFQSMNGHWGKLHSTHRAQLSSKLLAVLCVSLVKAVGARLVEVREAIGVRNPEYARLSSLAVDVVSVLGSGYMDHAERYVAGGGEASGLWDDMHLRLGQGWRCYLTELAAIDRTHHSKFFHDFQDFLASGLHQFTDSCAAPKRVSREQVQQLLKLLAV